MADWADPGRHGGGALSSSWARGGQALGGRGSASPLMMDFMSHFAESMLCNAISSSPGFSGDKAEFPSPAWARVGEGREETVWKPK